MQRIFAFFAISGLCLAADLHSALTQANAAIQRGDLDKAEQILKNATADTPPRNASSLDQPLETLSMVYRREKKFQEAAAVEQRRAGIWTSMFGEKAVVVARCLGQVATMERESRNLADAETHSRRALAIMTAAYPDRAPTAQAASDLADILIAEQKNEEADQMLAMSQKIFESSAGADSLLTAGVITKRLPLLRQLGRATEADQLAARPPAEVYRAVGPVLQPHILYQVEGKYSEEARKKKLQGSVSLSLIVDANGMPTHIVVLRPLGMGLDEQAAEAVATWKFTPGTKDGSPVAIFTQVEMNFHLL